MTAVAVERETARGLVSDQFFARLSKRVMTNNVIAPELADRITEQALAYLATAAQKPKDAPTLYMSPMVDLGWHAFMEYTKQYDEFFVSHGWPKVHHRPCDGYGGEVYPPAETVLPLTVQAIERAGYNPDPELWDANRVDCGDTCGDDGGGGNPPDCGHSH
ncbi:hypothetical protein ABTZ59_02730 [Streptomyces sp. NPDC094034]|uniref:hypothetical protein n=1 Tax=Streptomyces sp. NPDC094034 TaxID=3155309 RepID=UPI003327B889